MLAGKARYHCNEEMDYLGKHMGEHWFECSVCGSREVNDPNKPTTPEERPRKDPREYGSHTVIGSKPYRK